MATYLKTAALVTFLAASSPNLVACAPWNTPVAVSEVGWTVTSPQSGVVTVKGLSGAASANLKTVYLRAKRGNDVIAEKEIPWTYSSGIETTLGSAEKPVVSGDIVEVGTAPQNSHVSLTVK